MATLKAQNMITAGTGAVSSGVFEVGGDYLVSIYSKGTVGAGETIDLQVKNDLGSWQDVSDDAGAQVQLTDSISSLRVLGPGVFRLDKGVTAAAAGAFIYVGLK